MWGQRHGLLNKEIRAGCIAAATANLRPCPILATVQGSSDHHLLVREIHRAGPRWRRAHRHDAGIADLSKRRRGGAKGQQSCYPPHKSAHPHTSPALAGESAADRLPLRCVAHLEKIPAAQAGQTPSRWVAASGARPTSTPLG